ncbi:MAG: FixH family protein [Bacteroidia bacterium]
MKLDWSKILIGAMALFIVFIVSMGVKMATSSQALYEEDYYEQGEEHAIRMEQEKAGESVEVRFNRTTNSLDCEFEIDGYVSKYKLVCLADSKRDLEVSLSENSLSSKQSIVIPSKIVEGIWYYEVTGLVGKNAFFKKQQFVK